ncbi:MAG: putative DNA modification/repair radical SAM protein [Lachnospiraceae bacterium]|nr:putative DNA modification/repair radical SAM protein [Lachnospiraceae bacterium]
MVLNESLSMEEKLGILADAAKYDVACTSSGMQREGKAGEIGNSVAAGICHSFSADGRCISLLKVLFTNECIFDCKYCINRSSNDVPRASFTPRELCELTMGFYKRNYIEGLFLSSGILHTPDYTMELICQTLRMLREEYHFRGYIHCKAIPGANPMLVEYAGWYADRMSVNLELPTGEGLRNLAPHKSRKNILQPMRQIQAGIAESRQELGFKGGNHSAYYFTNKAAKQAGIEERFGKLSIEQSRSTETGPQTKESVLLLPGDGTGDTSMSATSARREGEQTTAFMPRLSLLDEVGKLTGRGFAAAGQSTQMIIGATPETDYQLVSVAEALYQKFDLKRVFYSAFVKVNDDSNLPDLPGGPPLLREHRLYQADWLMRYYGFRAGELLTEKRPNFNQVLDPKGDWAVHHLELFPVEVLKADYFLLLRIPGVGPKSAKRIVEARRSGTLSFEDLKKIGVVLKRAQYFITCGGRALLQIPSNEAYITQSLMTGEKLPKDLREALYGRQMSLFELPGFEAAAG